MATSLVAPSTRQRTFLQALLEARHLTREQTLEVLERRARALGVTDFALSLRQLDRLLASELVTRPRPSVRRVLEAEFGFPIAVLLAPEPEGPAPSPTDAEPSRTLRTTDFVAWIADHSDWSFSEVYAAVAQAADRTEAIPFAVRAAAGHARASRTRGQLAAAVQDYYGGPEGFYRATIAGTDLSLSLLTEPKWLDLGLCLDRAHQGFRLERSPAASRPVRLTSEGLRPAIERLAAVEVDETVLLDNPLYQLLSLDLAAGHVSGQLGLTTFAAYALTGDLLEGELVEAMHTEAGNRPKESHPLRDIYLPTRAAATAFDQRVGAGGPACLLAIARPDDYLLLVQKRSGRVVNVTGRLAVIPKAFHQPINDDQQVNLSATVDRELEEELLGRADLEGLTAADARRVAPLHPEAVSEPMRWLIDHPNAYQVETTAFGVNMVSGNYEFACLAVIDDPNWWARYGGRMQGNWEAAAILSYSSRDTEGLAQLAVDPTWSNEGLFALL